MEKNPFSFYDFLGYLFPGMLTLLIVIHITYLKEPSQSATISVLQVLCIPLRTNCLLNGGNLH